MAPNTANSSIGGAGTGGDDQRDNDENNKKRKNNSQQDPHSNEKKKEKNKRVINEEDEEQKKPDGTKLDKLDANAPTFVPRKKSPPYYLPSSHILGHKTPKSILDTIDEDDKEETESIPKRCSRSKKDRYPLPVKCAGTIEIPRNLTQNIIPATIKENILTVYYFMDKSMALRENRKILKNDNLVVINYDFHHHHTDEVLYCIIQKQDPAKHRGFSWVMMDRLFTKKQILNEFNVFETESMLPLSTRYDVKFMQQMDSIHPIYDIWQTQLRYAVFERTQWNRIPINSKTDNKHRKILYLTKKEFMNRIEYFSTNSKFINIIPIMILNSNKEYWIEHIYIIKIDENINIGISMKYKPHRNRIEVTGIHLNKQFIIKKHQLALPNHHCMCLDDFVSDIDDLKIGNIDEDKNRIKDLQKRHEIMKKEKDREAQKHMKFKQFVKRFISHKIPSQQLVTEAKEALDNDEDERSSPIIAAVSSNTNLNPINIHVTNPSNPTISVPTFSSSIPSSYTLSTPSYALSTRFSTVSTIGAPTIYAVSNRSQSTKSNAESHIESTK